MSCKLRAALQKNHSFHLVCVLSPPTQLADRMTRIGGVRGVSASNGDLPGSLRSCVFTALHSEMHRKYQTENPATSRQKQKVKELPSSDLSALSAARVCGADTSQSRSRCLGKKRMERIPGKGLDVHRRGGLVNSVTKSRSCSCRFRRRKATHVIMLYLLRAGRRV